MAPDGTARTVTRVNDGTARLVRVSMSYTGKYTNHDAPTDDEAPVDNKTDVLVTADHLLPLRKYRTPHALVAHDSPQTLRQRIAAVTGGLPPTSPSKRAGNANTEILCDCFRDALLRAISQALNSNSSRRDEAAAKFLLSLCGTIGVSAHASYFEVRNPADGSKSQYHYGAGGDDTRVDALVRAVQKAREQYRAWDKAEWFDGLADRVQAKWRATKGERTFSVKVDEHLNGVSVYYMPERKNRWLVELKYSDKHKSGDGITRRKYAFKNPGNDLDSIVCRRLQARHYGGRREHDRG